MSSRLDHEIHEQRGANESSEPYRAAYGSHRQHWMRQLLRHAGPDRSESICILGAGNCNDVELASLAMHYRDVHLVDLDAVALERARARVPERERALIVGHAPVDLSGMLAKLERWKRFEVTPEELIGHPEATAQALAAQLGASFDVVASACLMTQMQLAVLAALGETHRLFQAVRHTLSVTHLRTLAGLTRHGGHVVFASDLAASDHLPLSPDTTDEELKGMFEQVLRDGNAMYVAHPTLLGAMLRDDPMLRRALSPEPIDDIWLWQQGPERTFLVYAQHFVRRVEPSGPGSGAAELA